MTTISSEWLGGVAREPHEPQTVQRQARATGDMLNSQVANMIEAANTEFGRYLDRSTSSPDITPAKA